MDWLPIRSNWVNSRVFNFLYITKERKKPINIRLKIKKAGGHKSCSIRYTPIEAKTVNCLILATQTHAHVLMNMTKREMEDIYLYFTFFMDIFTVLCLKERYLLKVLCTFTLCWFYWCVIRVKLDKGAKSISEQGQKSVFQSRKVKGEVLSFHQWVGEWYVFSIVSLFPVSCLPFERFYSRFEMVNAVKKAVIDSTITFIHNLCEMSKMSVYSSETTPKLYLF